MEQFDIIIAGTGCAGFQLAYFMNRSPSREKKVLLLDKAWKKVNNRTWCFWDENDHNAFDEVVSCKWDNLSVKYYQQEKKLEMGNYQYKLIEAKDFYEHVKKDIKANPNFDYRHENILGIHSGRHYAQVKTRKHCYRAPLVFNSCPPDFKLMLAHPYPGIFQHFKGWFITTTEPFFHPGKALLMDFSVPQQRKQTRFAYVLPFNDQEALVEFTVFSLDFLSSREYEENLKKYIDKLLGKVSYEITRKEYGIIPLTTYRFQPPGERVVNIGMPGNMIKSSAGYTFLTMQAKLKKMVRRLEKGMPPSYRPSLLSHRFHMYDSTHLNVLQNGYAPGAKVFYRLFERNKGWRVLRFLDEETTVYQELFIFASVHIPSFLKGFLLYFRQLYNTRSKVF